MASPEFKSSQTGDPVKNERRSIRVLEITKYTCMVLGICVVFLLVPVFVIPVAIGPDKYGDYTIPRGRNQQAPSKVKFESIAIGSVFIVIASLGLFVGYLYVNDAHEKRKRAFLDAERLRRDGPAAQATSRSYVPGFSCPECSFECEEIIVSCPNCAPASIELKAALDNISPSDKIKVVKIVVIVLTIFAASIILPVVITLVVINWK